MGLFANVLGAFLAAASITYSPAFEPKAVQAMGDLSRHVAMHCWVEGFFKAIPARIRVAAIVWMIPTSQGGKTILIVIFTWLIAAEGQVQQEIPKKSEP